MTERTTPPTTEQEELRAHHFRLRSSANTAQRLIRRLAVDATKHLAQTRRHDMAPETIADAQALVVAAERAHQALAEYDTNTIPKIEARL